MKTRHTPDRSWLLDGLREEVARRQANPHLRTLGLPEGASSEEIQAAYRRLVRECHPDVGGDAGRMRQVVAAYEALR